jgi:ATP-dependent DNA helicase RecG
MRGEQKEIFYWKSRGEVDFVVKENNHLSAINVCFSNIIPDRETKSLLEFKEEFQNIKNIILLTEDLQKEENGIKFSKDEKIYEFIEKLPYELTNAQIKVLDEIIIDMQNEKIMNRIIQGDVGSGKTIVALIALYLAVLNGYQGSFMVPTEILAIQHFETIKNYFSNIDIKVRCLTSSVKNKEEIYEEISSGEVDIVIGTHALLQDQVKFNKLGLVITDEQHRFGVRQREKLAENKTTKPDILVMSATPIPRTLSMVIHGDLDISVIDEMPKGRKEISTHFIKKSKKQDMYDFIRKNILDGRQVYFVCPLVEDSDKLDLLSVEKHFQELDNTIFKDLTVKMIHGKLKNNEKDDIMMQFKNKEIDILIATTVIEVGIDVPNANIMVIENAERFGLSQLHQLRGRVGRGEFQSYCFLLSDKFGKIAKERIRIMVETNDGFKISQKDLEIRGPGEILGIKQSGIAEFKIANIIKNNDILIKTQDEIRNILMVYKSGESLEMIEFVNNKSKEILCGYKLN